MIISHNGTTITVDNEDQQYQILAVLYKKTVTAVEQPTKRVYRKRKGTKHRWTPEQKAEMLQLRNQGVSGKNIARRFGTTEKAVAQQLWQARRNARKVSVNVLPETVPAGFAR